MDKIVSCLTLRFTATPNEVRAALPATMEQWAKLRILPEGDTIHAAEMENPGEDTRDATYVRVRDCLFCTLSRLVVRLPAHHCSDLEVGSIPVRDARRQERTISKPTCDE